MSHDGETQWSTPVIQTYGAVDNERGVASSLAQTADHLFVLIDHHGPSASVVGDQVFVGSTTMYGGATDENATAGSNCCIGLTNVDGKPGYEVRWGAERANSYYSTPLAFAGYV
jgi:hypothetical protein